MRRFLSPLARPTGLLGTGFVAISAAIVANALFLQSGRHPAPLFTTRFEFAGAGAAAAGRRGARPSQSALKSAGYYAGPVDGIAGMQTASAIRAFEQRNGMTQTGRATPRSARRDPLARRAAFRPPASAGRAGAAAPRTPAPDERVAAVQAALSRAAYGPVKADGVFGPQTREAIVRFQRDHGLPLDRRDQRRARCRAAGRRRARER